MTFLSHGVWLGFGEPETARAAASAGFNWIGLDAQHGRFDDRAVLAALDRMPAAAPPVIVRVRSNDYGLIGRALDAGANGVIVPMVDTVEQATAAASAVRYPPLGARSWGPISGGYASAADANAAEPWCAVMIETAAALAAVESIAAVEGVTMLFVGPFDLAIALGVALDDLLADTSAASPLARIAAAAASAGITAGAFAGSPERGELLAGFGFTHVAIATDATLIERGAATVLGR